MAKQGIGAFFESLKMKIEASDLHHYFNYNSVVQLLVHGFVGFVFGFILKKFGRYFIFTIIVSGFAFYLLNHAGIASVDWQKFREVLGLAQDESLGSLVNNVLDWVKLNVDLSLSIAIGFIIGYKVG